MAKLRLVVDTLQVQSFTTQSDSPMRGTVRGAESAYVEAPSQAYFQCQSRANCESGNCAGTLDGICLTMRCTEHCTDDCVLEVWTNGQDTCQTCPSCATCPGILGC